MTEAIAQRLSFSEDDRDHPPTKKLKLDSEEAGIESQVFSEVELSGSNNNNSNNNARDDDDVFDPVQAILDAGKRVKEEEERQHSVSSSTNVDQERSNGKSSKDSEPVSVDNSEEESDNNDDDTSKEPKSTEQEIKKTKRKVKKKKKNSNFRKNIKDILQHDQLDDLTIAARKEEEDRRQRLNLKLQQLQQQQLQLLQQQQSQLLRESLSTPINYGSAGPPRSADFLMKKLIRKKHITVSLDESGAPQRNAVEECILLSSDEEETGSSNKPHDFFPSVPASESSHFNESDKLSEQFRKTIVSDEVIALSSDEESRADLPSSAINARLYAAASASSSAPAEGRTTRVDSDDDCVIISPEPETDEDANDKDECSQDLLNVPDHLGRVLVNVGHPSEDEDVFLPSQIAKIVKPHQIGGIRFLYDNVVESKDRYNESLGFGCILAHAMGLGKTLQTVAFCDAVLRTVAKTVLIIVPINTIQNWLNEFNRYLPAKESNKCTSESSHKKRSMKNKVKKCVKSNLGTTESNTNNIGAGKVCSDISEDYLNLTLDSTFHIQQNQNLQPEQTLPPPQCNVQPSVLDQDLPLRKLEEEEPIAVQESETVDQVDNDIVPRKFEVFLLNETVKSLQARERIITKWANNGGVLLIGYEMYRMLSLKKLKKSSRKAMTLMHEERIAEEESLNNIYDCLVEPGPDCVICDEGHRIKNSGAGISQALKSIKTKRRVVLTGYPLQNNLMEYWCMVDFVRPNYLGTKAEFSNMFERPIQNGQCADSTFEDKRLMKYRSHVLHSLLEGFVQRRSHVVLRNALPQKEEWVFLVKLTPVQLRIYREFIRYLREDLDSDNASTNPIKAFAVCCKIWNHPDVLWNVVKKNLDLEMDLDIDEVRHCGAPKPRSSGRPRGRPPLNSGLSIPGQPRFDPFEGKPSINETSSGRSDCSGISLEWAKPLFENYTPEVMENGVKFELLFQLLEETVSVGDKLLVFSQSLLTLDLMECFLKKRLNWSKSVEYVRLDGSTAGLEREKLINEFNKSTVQKLFLISTRAGSLGINLVGANRVCIFDASWNPCHDSQAVCRIYRYGQTKPCHIYRFVSDCTLEKRIYDRQVNKKGMADRIVDEMNPNTPFKSKDVSSFLVLQHDLLEKLPYIRCDLDFEKYSDPVLKNVLEKMGDRITQEPFEHESLLIDQKHQRLSKSEKRLALKNYEQEKKTVANAYTTYSRPSYAQYYSSINSSSSSSYQSSYSSVSRYDDHRSSSSATSLDSFQRSRSDGYGSMGNASFDKFELHISALKTRGIAVFPVQLHQDTFLKDPSGSHDLFIGAGDRVYILVSQKGTYLRVQGKLLRVPFVGTEMTQEQAEHFVVSLLQSPQQDDSRHAAGSRSRGYPVEQQLPPSNIMLQKNPNHLQITNSRNNSGGDVMMGSSSWSRKSARHHHHHQHSTLPEAASALFSDDRFGCNRKPTQNESPDMNPVSQSDLQSLSRLAESFGQHSSSAMSTSLYSSDNSKQWSPSPSLTPKPDTASSQPEMEVIKVANTPRSSSNSSNSCSSQTASPYQHAWNNASDGSGGGHWRNKESFNSTNDRIERVAENPSSFYTDFTITPVAHNGSKSSRKKHTHVSDKYCQSQSKGTPNDYFAHNSPNPFQMTPETFHGFGNGNHSQYNPFFQVLNSQAYPTDFRTGNQSDNIITESSDRMMLNVNGSGGGSSSSSGSDFLNSSFKQFENKTHSHL